MTGVLIVDDQQLLRRGLRMLLELDPELTVVAEAADGREALAMIERHHPDVVLTDARMPRMDGIELVEACRQQHPGLPVLVLTTFDDEPIVLGSIDAGAAGFLLKDTSPERLADSIRAALRGELVIDPRVARLIVTGRGDRKGTTDGPLDVLTRTERIVAACVAAGTTNGDIAAQLVLSEGTVKNHVSNLLRKLDQPNRTALALFLLRHLEMPTD